MLKGIGALAIASLMTLAAVAVTGANDLVAQEAPSLVGDWAGDLALPDGREVGVIFRVVESEDGTLSSTLDVPAQGAAGLACTETAVEGTELRISGCEIPGGGGYDGKLNEDGTGLTGEFNQAGMPFPLDLAPAETDDG